MSKIKVNAKWVQNVQSIADNSRGHSLVLDLGTAKGGDNTGPSALELAIMSLADCAVTIFADVCKQSNVEISKMDVIAEADKPADSPKLTGVNLKVTVTSKSRKQKLDAVWRRTESNCPVVSIFQDNIPIKIEFETITE
ncbi:OsmC family protein [Candidatus Bathyarchaeota archaeon]|nr:OsmC family protein [Candidatus Bathyarchaeota archaeon]